MLVCQGFSARVFSLAPVLMSFFLTLGCQRDSVEPNKDDESEQKFVLEETINSMGIEDVNKYIAESNVMLLFDLNTNMGLAFRKGVLKYVFPIISGGPSDQNFSKSKTHLGLFTSHALERCPPRVGKDLTKYQEDPCSEGNFLGTNALWHRREYGIRGGSDYMFGAHGRPEHNIGFQKKAFFDSTSAQRKTYSMDLLEGYATLGCIGIPHKYLVKTIDLILEDPAFKGHLGPEAHHPGLQAIKKFRAEGSTKNVFIPLMDINKEIPNFKGIKTAKTPAVPIDIKFLIFDTSDPKAWKSIDFLEQSNPFLKMFKSKVTFEMDVSQRENTLWYVKECTASGEVVVYENPAPESKTPKILTTLQKGDVLKLSAYTRHEYSPSAPALFSTVKEGKMKITEGWVYDVSRLDCKKKNKENNEGKNNLNNHQTQEVSKDKNKEQKDSEDHYVRLWTSEVNEVKK